MTDEQSIATNKENYSIFFEEQNAINKLGESLYYYCVSLFQEVFERQSTFKIIMTRRCFSLYKIIAPILSSKGISNRCGEIITDHALPLRINEISKALMNQIQNKDSKSDTVIVVDDIIIYGRTVNNLLDNIISGVKDANNIENNEITHMLLNHMRVLCITQNLWNSKIRDEYKPLVLARTYSTSLTCKNKSCKFSELIKSADVANTSYIVSYRKKFSQEVYDKIYNNTIEQKYMVENTSKELKKFHVRSYVTRVSTPIILKGIETKGYLRMYFYEQTNSIMVSPLIILEDISEDVFLSFCNEIVKKLCNRDTMHQIIEILNSKEVKCYSVKARLANLLLSHIILVRFLKQCFETDLNIPTCIDDFDFQEIIKYNFNEDISKEFKYYHYNLHEIVLNSFNLNDFYCKTGIKVELEEKLSKSIFKRAMSDNRAALDGEENRLSGINIINDQTKQILDFAFTRLLLFIDNGVATLKTFFCEETSQFMSAIFPGEQAFRIMYDKFEDFIPLFYEIENFADLHELKPYKLYHDFIDKLPNNVFQNYDFTKQEFHDYIDILKDNNQQISDIYAYSDKENSSLYEQHLDKFLEEVSK